ncbi:hypothetical protein DPX16_1492 [Anabarilius grahami]|uniref:Uncharacterized protein n=1 Tax=Anabarilius grahami TaxID=495550 RepID=A0A3N0YYK5_ANAGA|nr:hypothetical protein DPX16_1492 [Anabarilius grahami]
MIGPALLADAEGAVGHCTRGVTEHDITPEPEGYPSEERSESAVLSCTEGVGVGVFGLVRSPAQPPVTESEPQNPNINSTLHLPNHSILDSLVPPSLPLPPPLLNVLLDRPPPEPPPASSSISPLRPPPEPHPALPFGCSITARGRASLEGDVLSQSPALALRFPASPPVHHLHTIINHPHLKTITIITTHQHSPHKQSPSSPQCPVAYLFLYYLPLDY